MPSSSIDLLVFLFISDHQADELKENLVKQKFFFTEIHSSGGVFVEPALCLLIGLNHAHMDGLMGIVKQCCQSYSQYIPVQLNAFPDSAPISMIEAQAGGALIYTLSIERFEQI